MFRMSRGTGSCYNRKDISVGLQKLICFSLGKIFWFQKLLTKYCLIITLTLTLPFPIKLIIFVLSSSAETVLLHQDPISLGQSLVSRVTKTLSARQQCWLESFCKSGKFLRQVHYWLKIIRILCNTKYPDNMQSVRMHWKVSGQSKQCPDNLEKVSG